MTKNNKKKRDNKGIFLRLSKYVLQQWPLFIVAVALTLGANQLSLLGPKYSGEAIDAIANPKGIDFSFVQKNIVLMIICYVLSAVLSYVLAILMIHVSQKIVYTMRRQLFEKL